MSGYIHRVSRYILVTMNKILLLVLLYTCTGICKNEKRNLFNDINEYVQNILNNIFVLLRLNNKFTADFNNRVLLTMHAFMKTVSENKYKGYSDIKRAAKLSSKHNSNDGVSEHDNLTSVLVQEILTPIKAKSDQINKTGINLPLTSLKIPEQWEESLSFLKEYFKNMEEALSVDAHVKYIRNSVRRKNMNVRLKKNLKAWKATNATDAINNGTDTRRVFKGESVNINTYPFIASIHVAGEFVCAGSIISKDMILTAATCLHAFLYDTELFKNSQDIEIRVGSDYTLRLGNFHRVSQIYFHPRYNVENLHNNLAILRIDNFLHFKRKKKVRRIEYQRWKGGLGDQFQEVVMLGWGDKGPEISGLFDSLSYSRLKIFDQERCKDTYSRKYVNSRNFCAGFKHKGSGACQRDVGGPAIMGDVLVGVVSFGPPVCGTPDAPTVFTNIGQYNAWIDSVVKKVNSQAMKLPIVSSTLLPALLQPKHQNDNHQFVERSGKKTLSRKKKPKVVPISKYPPAIKILQDFLKRLRGGTYLDDMLYEADDNRDERSDEGIVIDVDDNVSDDKDDGQPYRQGRNTMPTPNDNKEGVDSKLSTPSLLSVSDDEDDDQPFKQGRNTMPTLNDNKEGVDNLRANQYIKNDRAPTINTSDIVQNFVSGLRSEFIKSKLTSGTEDPFLLAMKSLENYLGLNFIRIPEQARYRSNQMTEYPHESNYESQNHDKTSSASTSSFHLTEKRAVETDSLENTIRTEVTANTKSYIDNSGKKKQSDLKKSDKIFSPEESDNYESESQGMSIEVKEEEMKPIPRAHTKTAETIEENSDETQTSKEYHDKAQMFLNRNFVKDINASLTNIDEQHNEEEFVVLLLKTTTPKPDIPNRPNKGINVLDTFNQHVIKASHFSVISDFNTSLQSIDKNNIKSKIEIELPSNVLQTILSNKIPITQLRSVADNNYSSVLLTPATGATATSDISNTNINQINSNISYNLTKVPLLYNHPKISSTATAFTKTQTSVVTDSTLVTSTNKIPINNANNATDSKVDVLNSTSTIADFAMAAYDLNEEKEEDDDDADDILNDSDLDIRRRVLDYINIT